jgi:predicted alpha/beta-fold hydrolase
VNPFRPPWFLPGGHSHTLFGYWLRRRLRFSPPAEDIVVESGGGVRLLVRASWQREAERRPTVLLVHGLGGSDASSYSASTGALFWEAGWNVARMNMRGSGDGEAHCAQLYNAGLDGDMITVLQAVAARTPHVAPVGFSLGANLLLLALGRSRERVPAGVFAAAAVSPPLDLGACADALRRRWNQVYERHYVRNLRAAYARRQRQLPEMYEAGREEAVRSVREFDHVITAHYFGFGGADDYYTRSSAGPWVAQIDRPTLMLAAKDDPMIPIATVARWPLPPSGAVRLEITETGGHVGFVARTRAGGRFWAAERVLEYLEEQWARRARSLDRTDPAA